MKKMTLFLFLSFSLLLLNAQNHTNFVQAGIGMSVEHQDDYLLFVEYGQTWKWLSVSSSLSFESTFPIGTSKSSDDYIGVFQLSLMLNARVNIIRLIIEDSRHALMIGGGFGYGYEKHQPATVNSRYLWTGALRASYEYVITPNLSLGAFFHGSYLPCVGLSVCRKF